ncbi:uncharacterized protein B0P05DRAFT_185153 [Gilbertella persicaria]|uniref:uncharacterized protein n=1 Tax=Gilbertella persicaria TaxID=101096 RepID=UPI0022212794|nr:uncharacterized protein B0P05DRAFT_185153 [Gilbertella persicaria]KAI8070593.1 hypothetical protein B0P05DRAFT_185153 [Gilbertella persicaria]
MNKTSVARRVLSLSIVAYLGYNFLLGCGSPLDQNSQKPAVCEAIDPIKLDLMALYQSEFYQYKVHPHLLPVLNTATDYYDQYGAPQQAKLVHLYNQHGKPVLNKAHVMYQDRLLPTLLPYLDTCKIYLDQAKIYADPYVAKATQKALLAQEAIEYQWHHTLPPHVQRACDATFHTVKEWYERAEQTDMVPILLDFYWHLVDFMQYQFWPAIQSSHVTHKLKSEYDQYLKQYVDQHLKPVWVKYNDQVHLDQWLAHVLAVLPQRTIQQATSGSLMAQTKTSTVPTTTQDIPITQKVVSQPTLAETIGINHDEDIVKETSVASATKAVVTENHVVPVPEEKELFEQNPVPPQSPTHFDAQGKEDVLEQKVIKPVKENVEAVKENANTEKQVVEEKVEEAKKAADENIVKPLKQAKEQVMDHVEEAKDAAKVKMEDVKEIMEDRVVDIKQTVEENTNEAKKQQKRLKKLLKTKQKRLKKMLKKTPRKQKIV